MRVRKGGVGGAERWTHLAPETPKSRRGRLAVLVTTGRRCSRSIGEEEDEEEAAAAEAAGRDRSGSRRRPLSLDSPLRTLGGRKQRMPSAPGDEMRACMTH